MDDLSIYKQIFKREPELQDNILLHGKQHISLAFTYNNMGGLYFNNNDYSKASDCYDAALKIAIE
jgi:tetratricopeptide (TPR) repeat protein